MKRYFKPEKSILTIDPGTHKWGVSVFHGAVIMDLRVKHLNIQGRKTDRKVHKAKEIFRVLCAEYQPQVLVIEKPLQIWMDQSKHLTRIIQAIKQVARQNHIRIIEFTPKTVSKILCNTNYARKKDVIEVLQKMYPELRDYLSDITETTSSSKYIVNSLALGACYEKRYSSHSV